jgi:hypothetical protein
MGDTIESPRVSGREERIVCETRSCRRCGNSCERPAPIGMSVPEPNLNAELRASTSVVSLIDGLFNRGDAGPYLLTEAAT